MNSTGDRDYRPGSWRTGHNPGTSDSERNVSHLIAILLLRLHHEATPGHLLTCDLGQGGTSAARCGKEDRTRAATSCRFRTHKGYGHTSRPRPPSSRTDPTRSRPAAGVDRPPQPRKSRIRIGLLRPSCAPSHRDTAQPSRCPHHSRGRRIGRRLGSFAGTPYPNARCRNAAI